MDTTNGPSRPQPPLPVPRLNEPAPPFAAPSTHGPIALGDYLGRYVVLFAHPADFTPVCATEFVALAEQYDRFQALGCDLLGLSVDSIPSHLAWVRAIAETFGIEIPFPIIADRSMEVAHRYGMVHPGASDTSTVRAAFVIDDSSVLRAMLYYPMDAGRSVAELLRLVQALQTTDAHRVATPEGWQPGDRVILPPPTTAQAADARLNEAGPNGYDCIDWYLCTKRV
ncbi:MAG: peroxiredoxin [Bacteroidetes bacterium]|jgi:peroxiredoxin (alkyl hydroperoxide reductase subunit C)|nr:peroxiredoxin [Bacteroidota bacterium]